MKEMRAKRLEPKLEIPLLGYNSVVATIAAGLMVRSPFGEKYCRAHSCNAMSWD